MIDILSTLFGQAVETYTKYKGSGFVMELFYICVIYVFIVNSIRINGIRKAEGIAVNIGEIRSKTYAKIDHAYMIGFIYPLIMLFVIFNPLVVGFITKIAGDVYWRMFWLVPVPLVIAYVAADVCTKFNFDKSLHRIVTVLLMIIIIAISGSFSYTRVGFRPHTNWFKLPDSAVAVCNILEKSSHEQVKVVVPDSISSHIRQYDASIYMPYGRATRQNSGHSRRLITELHQQVNGENINFAQLRESMIALDCNAVVIGADKPLTDNAADSGFVLLDMTHNFLVFELVD